MADTVVNALQLNSRGVISLIGAGGKTSLMFCLAKELAGFKKKVLTTTTTKILTPDKEQSPCTLLADSFPELEKKVKSCLSRYNHFSAGSENDPAQGKIEGFNADIIDQLWQKNLFDWIIVEADGAAQKALKASDSHEPVIPKATTVLILVTGLDAKGKPLDDKHVHRSELFSKNTGLGSGQIIDESSIAACIDIEINKANSLSGPVRSIVFLNKADNHEKVISAKKIAQLLQTNRFINKIITGSLLNEPLVKECLNTQ